MEKCHLSIVCPQATPPPTHTPPVLLCSSQSSSLSVSLKAFPSLLQEKTVRIPAHGQMGVVVPRVWGGGGQNIKTLKRTDRTYWWPPRPCRRPAPACLHNQKWEGSFLSGFMYLSLAFFIFTLLNSLSRSVYDIFPPRCLFVVLSSLMLSSLSALSFYLTPLSTSYLARQSSPKPNRSLQDFLHCIWWN